MQISARVVNRRGEHLTHVRTGGKEQSLAVPAKDLGCGSAVNGGELLFLALATCYCNDLYREAEMRGVRLESVEVEVSGEFGGRGEPARAIRYRAAVEGNGSKTELMELMRDTDLVAEIQNTLRQATPVLLMECSVAESKQML